MKDRNAGSARVAEHLLEAQEAERERIARALHDDLGQQVASLSILTSTLKRRLPPHEKEACEQVQKIREKLLVLAQSMRSLSHEVYPTLLEHAGIGIAIRQLLEERASKIGVQFSFNSHGDLQSVPLKVALAAYRIVEGAIDAFAKDGRQIEVALAAERGELHLTVGTRKTEPLSQSAFEPYLEILHQRVRTLSGSLDLEPSEKGLRLAITIPLALRAKYSAV